MLARQPAGGGCGASLLAAGFGWLFPFVGFLSTYETTSSGAWLEPWLVLLTSALPFLILLGYAIFRKVKKKDSALLIGVLIGLGVFLLIFGLCVAGLSMM